MGVGIVEGPVQRADELHPEQAGLREARHQLETEIGPQGRLDGTQEEDVVLGGVVPVARSFGPAAVRGERRHRADDRPPGVIDDLAGQLGLAIGHRERPTVNPPLQTWFQL